MSARTETTTRPLGSYYLVMPNNFDEFKAKSLDYLKKLSRILDVFRNYEDSLSLRIQDWGNDIFINVLKKNSDFDSIKNDIVERINILVSEVLVDPLYNSPLREPVLERSWVWEKSVLDEYKTLHAESLNSPFDGETMQIPTEHLFAKEMLIWIQNIPFFKWDPVERNQSFDVVIKADLSPQEKAIKFLLLKRLAKAFLTVKSLKDLEIKTLEVEVQIEKQRILIIQELQKELELAEIRALEHEEKLDQKIELVKCTHATERAILETTLDVAQVEISIQQQNISALNTVCAKQEQTINGLNNQCANLTQKVRNLESRSGGGGCSIL